MKIIYPDSLAETLDAFNVAHFYGMTISNSEREEIAEWIASRQGLPMSYANMFAPTEKDFSEHTKVFTGEALTLRAGISHILGEEACRAMIMLDVKGKAVREAMKRAQEGLMSRRGTCGDSPGHYCCGICSVSLWRHLMVGGLKDQDRELAGGVKRLKAFRDGKSKWRVYPFHYTLLALDEIDTPAAIEELRYAAPSIERIAKRPANDKYGQRRKDLAEKILGKI